MLAQTEGAPPHRAILGCTHFPLVEHLFRRHLPPFARILSQPDVVADSFEDYLARHPHYVAGSRGGRPDPAHDRRPARDQRPRPRLLAGGGRLRACRGLNGLATLAQHILYLLLPRRGAASHERQTGSQARAYARNRRQHRGALPRHRMRQRASKTRSAAWRSTRTRRRTAPSMAAAPTTSAPPAAARSSWPIRRATCRRPRPQAEPVAPDAIYTCPMHPEIRQVGPGSCPICGMALEPVIATADDRAQPRTRRHDAALLDRRSR